MKKIKVAILIPNLYGGTGTFAKNLGKGFKKYVRDKYDLILVMFNKKGFNEKDKELFDDVKIINSEIHTDFRRFFETFLHLYYLKKIIREIKPDIVFSIGTYLNILSFFSFKKNKLILSEHDVPSVRLKYSTFGKLIKFIAKSVYKKSVMVGISKVIIKNLKKNFKVKKAFLIYYGIDNKRIQKYAEEQIEENILNRPYVVFVGRFTLQKDVFTLIKGYFEAFKKGIKENLLLIGEGEEKDNIIKLIKKLGLEKKVFLLGYKENPYKYIKRAKALILSSIWEGLPYILLEAISLGIPVISTDCPSGPSEILEDGKFGILVPVKNYKRLGEAIYELLRDSDKLKEFQEKAIKRSEFFSLKKMVNFYDNLFSRVNERRI